MKKFLLILMILLVAAPVFAAGTKAAARASTARAAYSEVIFTPAQMADARVDTIILNRDPFSYTGTTGTIALHSNDSVSITYMRVYRIVDNVWQPLVATDTVTAFTAFTATAAAQADTVKLGTWTLSPYPDAYGFVFLCGTGNGTTAAKTHKFRFPKIFYAKPD